MPINGVFVSFADVGHGAHDMVRRRRHMVCVVLMHRMVKMRRVVDGGAVRDVGLVQPTAARAAIHIAGVNPIVVPLSHESPGRRRAGVF